MSVQKVIDFIDIRHITFRLGIVIPQHLNLTGRHLNVRNNNHFFDRTLPVPVYP